MYINLAGGVDSFNILTPHPNGRSCNLYDEYYRARGGEPHASAESKNKLGIGLKEHDILEIDGSSQNIDGCSKFGVNKQLSTYRDIFDDGDGLFFANSKCTVSFSSPNHYPCAYVC